MEGLYVGRIDDVVELVAYHFGRAQVWDKAATGLRQASLKAEARSAYQQAAACLDWILQSGR